MWLRKNVELLDEQIGGGAPVERQQHYRLAIRMTLNRGDIVRCPGNVLPGPTDEPLQAVEDGYSTHRVRINRDELMAGIFYAVQGMNVGGYRKVAIGPQLAYGPTGVPEFIPPNAKLTVEIKVLQKL